MELPLSLDAEQNVRLRSPHRIAAGRLRRKRPPEIGLSTVTKLAEVGDWYTIGVSLGLGLGLGVILSALLGVNTAGLSVALVAGTATGALVGIAVGEVSEAIAGGIGGFLGALSAAAVVYGAMRRGATWLGLAAFVGLGGVLVALAGLIPILGYVEAVALPVAAARMRGRQASRFAGLRTLAK
jgi:hypothetical protein